ncbi:MULTISPECIES: hypothetical protein [unclassified Paraflavitalea]|uniref:hypothetical protein n=1 Tax=unclassified Paraflavitalea TaxID=2798305 RepID=UPI003D33776C
MKINFWLLLLLSLLNTNLLAQVDDSLFTRLQAISNNGVDFFNVDGIEITSQNMPGEFSKKNILKKYKRYNIKESDLVVSDSILGGQNYVVSKSEEIITGTVQYTSYYFIENNTGGITAITFGGFHPGDKDFERNLTQLILNKKIPSSLFHRIEIDSINFAGRMIKLGGSCHWMGINNVQCPYNGQMNWSVHKTLVGASAGITDQYNLIKSKKVGKILSEDTVDILFEGKPAKAIKAVYDIKGVKSLLVGMSGAKTLTVYFVAAPATLYYVSCVMSFWDNDLIGKDGLPALLQEVMQLNVPKS